MISNSNDPYVQKIYYLIQDTQSKCNCSLQKINYLLTPSTCNLLNEISQALIEINFNMSQLFDIFARNQIEDNAQQGDYFRNYIRSKILRKNDLYQNINNRTYECISMDKYKNGDLFYKSCTPCGCYYHTICNCGCPLKNNSNFVLNSCNCLYSKNRNNTISNKDDNFNSKYNTIFYTSQTDYTNNENRKVNYETKNTNQNNILPDYSKSTNEYSIKDEWKPNVPQLSFDYSEYLKNDHKYYNENMNKSLNKLIANKVNKTNLDNNNNKSIPIREQIFKRKIAKSTNDNNFNKNNLNQQKRTENVTQNFVEKLLSEGKITKSPKKIVIDNIKNFLKYHENAKEDLKKLIGDDNIEDKIFREDLTDEEVIKIDNFIRNFKKNLHSKDDRAKNNKYNNINRNRNNSQDTLGNNSILSQSKRFQIYKSNREFSSSRNDNTLNDRAHSNTAKTIKRNPEEQKILLKKLITDKKYNYKEFPRGWTGIKEYFINNGSTSSYNKIGSSKNNKNGKAKYKKMINTNINNKIKYKISK